MLSQRFVVTLHYKNLDNAGAQELPLWILCDIAARFELRAQRFFNRGESLPQDCPVVGIGLVRHPFLVAQFRPTVRAVEYHARFGAMRHGPHRTDEPARIDTSEAEG